MPEVDVRARRLIQWVRQQGLEKFNAKITRIAMGGDLRKDFKLMDDACTALVDAHLIKADPSRAGGLPGRMAKDFLVNPVVWSAQAAA